MIYVFQCDRKCYVHLLSPLPSCSDMVAHADSGRQASKTWLPVGSTALPFYVFSFGIISYCVEFVNIQFTATVYPQLYTLSGRIIRRFQKAKNAVLYFFFLPLDTRVHTWYNYKVSFAHIRCGIICVNVTVWWIFGDKGLILPFMCRRVHAIFTYTCYTV